MRLSKGLLIEM
ncbi:hypothetical protein SEVIR_9G180301v4 [Setaria viridis]